MDGTLGHSGLNAVEIRATVAPKRRSASVGGSARKKDGNPDDGWGADFVFVNLIVRVVGTTDESLSLVGLGQYLGARDFRFLRRLRKDTEKIFGRIEWETETSGAGIGSGGSGGSPIADAAGAGGGSETANPIRAGRVLPFQLTDLGSDALLCFHHRGKLERSEPDRWIGWVGLGLHFDGGAGLGPFCLSIEPCKTCFVSVFASGSRG